MSLLRKIAQTIVLYGIGLPLACANSFLHFASPMGDENWRMSGNPLRCGIALTIPDYGVAYFEQYATKEPHFILRKWEELERNLQATVTADPPVWKPGWPSAFITKTLVSPGKYALYLKRQPALKVLAYLSQGYQANFRYTSEQGLSTTVSISPIRFQKVYGKYQRCLANLLPYNYEDVKNSVIHFDIDSYELKDEDKELLRRIATYVQADETIEVVKVAGYSDDSGRKGYNNAVSEYRAKAVLKYLLRQGLPKYRLSTTWYGQTKPIARNDTDSGRAANRRVTIILHKK